MARKESGSRSALTSVSGLPRALRELLGQAPVVVGEDSDAFWQLVDALGDAAGAADNADWVYVHQAACAAWELRRLRAARAALLEERIRHGEELAQYEAWRDEVISRFERAAAKDNTLWNKLSVTYERAKAVEIDHGLGKVIGHESYTDAVEELAEYLGVSLGGRQIDFELANARAVLDATLDLRPIDDLIGIHERRFDTTLSEIDRRHMNAAKLEAISRMTLEEQSGERTALPGHSTAKRVA